MNNVCLITKCTAEVKRADFSRLRLSAQQFIPCLVGNENDTLFLPRPPTVGLYVWESRQGSNQQR